MRLNLSHILRTWTIATSIALIALSGCSSTSSVKMPGSNWFSWGKKKPAATSLAAKKKTELPAPPSSSATPNQPPTYAQAPGTTSQPTRTAWNSTGMPTNNPTGQDYGASYANASYPGASNSSQGFYSPDYRQPAGVAGGTPSYPSTPNSAGTPGGAATPYGGYASPSNQYTQSTAPNAGAAYSAPQYSAPSPPYGNAPSTQAYGTQGGYDQSSSLAPPQGYAGSANTGYSDGNPSYGYSGGSAYPETNAGAPYPQTAPNMSSMTASQQDPSAGGYRPGSTSRTTPYGTSDSLRVADAAGIQPASFSGSGSQAAPATTQGPYPTTPQTPAGEGSGYSYPSTYR